ncbi:AbiH family protein [Flavobacterium oreochromis]|uniref:AbiH family protein n=1 Tax=Flavobacterium oreochromis TaxID=2906078 RepID=UPI00385C7FF7
MNRIILIGNGFDLAHGMKTSYNDFINDYWESTIKKVQKYYDEEEFENEEIKISNLPTHWYPGYDFENFEKSLKNGNAMIQFKNKFLEVITNKKQIQNWVDIESEYYRLLKESFKTGNRIIDIRKLNKDFLAIRELLREYLVKEEEKFKSQSNNQTIMFDIGKKIYADFKPNNFTIDSFNLLLESQCLKLNKIINGLTKGETDPNDLNSKDSFLIGSIGGQENIKQELAKKLKSPDSLNYFTFQPKEILFLNFNYTKTEEIYQNHNGFEEDTRYKELLKKPIHIHGTLKEKNNDMIFGFGDELDQDYKLIEDLNNNEYLENIKSIKYLETNNYKEMLEFINTDEYQVFIFGHSCGISDRTLLNTLFEHKNCVSIKPFYHKKQDSSDNYSDILKNISRNFNDKAVMRDKVVNKEYCEPLVGSK